MENYPTKEHIMDPDFVEPETDSFAKEIGKTFTLSLVSTMGLLGGLFLTGLIVEKRNERKKPETTETPESE
jgi:hypothetical protein